MTFKTLNLDTKITKALEQAGYVTPTQIQAQAIPKIMTGQDLRASAQTGTGKTAAFLLPALNRLIDFVPGKGPRILILVPTRELAMQIEEQTKKYSQSMRVKTVCVVGGVPYNRQAPKLAKPHDILIATPGRLIDFIQQKKVDLSRVEMLVLDEADRMLDMGFSKPVEQIVKLTPSSRQTLLFSATLGGNILKLSERLMNNPDQLEIHAKKAKHDNIEQRLYYVNDMGHKNRLLDHFLNQEAIDNIIIFTSTKRHADRLVRELNEKDYHAAALHGDMKQRQRTRTIAQMRTGKVKVLVATDVAARGIDIPTISHVINFDLPRNTEDYVHRIGRTGRAGSKGLAFSFAGGGDRHLVKQIEKFTGQSITTAVVEGLEPKVQKKDDKPTKSTKSHKAAAHRFKRKTNKKPTRRR